MAPYVWSIYMMTLLRHGIPCIRRGVWYWYSFSLHSALTSMSESRPIFERYATDKTRNQ